MLESQYLFNSELPSIHLEFGKAKFQIPSILIIDTEGHFT